MTLNRTIEGPLDTLLELRDITDGAETATAVETGISFPCRKLGAYKAVLNVSSVKISVADETYAFAIGVSDLVGGTYTTIASLTSAQLLAAVAAGDSRIELPLSGNLAQLLDADSDWIQCSITIGGTLPSITYGCHLEEMR